MKLTFLFLFGFTSFTYAQTWQQTNGPYGGDVRALGKKFC